MVVRETECPDVLGILPEVLLHLVGAGYARNQQHMNVLWSQGFQIALPPYRMKRHGYIPRVSTSGQIGMAYNANNEQKFYKEFRTEASDNIMSLNYYNPYYINSQLSR